MVSSLLGPGLLVPTGQDRFNPGHLPAVVAQERGVLQLPALLLDPEIETLVLEVATTRSQFFVGQFFQFLNLLHNQFSTGLCSLF